MYRTDDLSGEEPDWHGAPTGKLFPAKGSADPAVSCFSSTVLSRGADQAEFIEPRPQPGFDIIYGTWLDDCLYLAGEAAETLLERVSVRLMALDGNQFPKRRPPLLATRLSCVVANALRAQFFRESGWVAFRREKGEYRGRHPWVRPEALATVIDGLGHAGLLETFPGHWCACSSTYRLADALTKIVFEYGVTRADIHRRPPARGRLVVLRSGDDKAELPYETTDETDRWIDDLDRYNHFIGQHDLGLNLTDEEKAFYLKAEVEARSPHDRQPSLIQPELFNRHLYRIFNDGTWEHGGRFYRGWWQNVPSELRKNITIDGEPTSELDYSGFLPRSIYHLNGIDYPADDDPYVFPELVSYALELGKPHDYFRKSAKKVLVALLNGEGELSHPERVELKVGFLPKYSRADVERMISEKHPFLCQFFRTGEGKNNQRLDADIASSVMTTLMDEGLLVLPIHDSFVIDKKHTDRLRDLMTTTYKDKVGYNPVID